MDKADISAEGARCANEQGKFWPMHDMLFANQMQWQWDVSKVDFPAVLSGYAASIGLNVNLFNSCVASNKYAAAIQQDILEGTSYGVMGTPNIYILLPKSATVDLNAILALQLQVPDGSGIKITEDCGYHIILVPGAYPQSIFKTILDSVK